MVTFRTLKRGDDEGTDSIKDTGGAGHPCYPSTEKTGFRGPEFPGQPGLHCETLSHTKQKQKQKSLPYPNKTKRTKIAEVKVDLAEVSWEGPWIPARQQAVRRGAAQFWVIPHSPG